MRPEITKQITNLRLKGLGYKSIAIVVGTSKENVRYFCKTHGLDGNAELVKLNFEEHKKHPEVCKQCGGKILRVPHSGKKLFCSDECRRNWWKEHPEEAKHSKAATYKCECSYCQRVFYAYGNKNRKYCSHDCYIQARFWTDPDMKVDKKEIAKRQEISGKLPTEVILKKIS